MRRRDLFLSTGAIAAAQNLVPVEELANTHEMEQMARRKLSPELFAEIAGGDREAFDRITFRPRMMVNTLGLDLTTELFGRKHFAPILVGPMANHGRYHSGGEQATLAGAAAAKTSVVMAASTSLPLAQLTLPANHWAQIDPARNPPPGAAALIVTAPFNWTAIEKLARASRTPVLAKGILTEGDAKAAIDRGAAGIIVSNYRRPAIHGLASPIEVLPAIAAAAGGKVPVLIDGGFRRGSDILKALALGARAVLVGRPVLWGLAAYGARGVQQVLEQLQTELARDMAMCGLKRCGEASPQYVKIHRR